MNEILRLWKAIENSDREHRLFESYSKARGAYLAEVRAHAKGSVGADKLVEFYNAERDAFSAYLEHRLHTKPE
jgi:hypothetical protein